MENEPVCAQEGELIPALPPKPRPLGGRHAGYRQPDRMRGRIQTGMLISRLQKIARGDIDGNPQALMVQVNAARVLLAKSLPDLQTVTLAGDENAPLVILTRME